MTRYIKNSMLFGLMNLEYFAQFVEKNKFLQLEASKITSFVVFL
jgi:hypothetical protein